MKNIKQIIISLLITTTLGLNAQVAINTDGTDADASAILDVKSTEKGFLPPRMTLSQRDAITSPTAGLLVYQTDGTAGLYQYNGSAWSLLGDSGIPTGVQAGDMLYWNGSDWVDIQAGSHGAVLQMRGGVPTWVSEPLPLPFTENFDTQVQFDRWELIVGGSSSDTWQRVTDVSGNTLDGTPFAFVNSDALGAGSSMDEYLVSPFIDASGVSDLYVHFDIFYNNLSGDEYAEVSVYNGTSWIAIYNTSEDNGGWGSPSHLSIEVSEHINDHFRIRFHYYSPGWNWYWAVDNVSVTKNAGK